MSWWTCDFFRATKLGSCDKHPAYCLGLNVIMCLCAIFHYRNERGTGAEMHPAVVSGIVTGDAPISHWPIFFSLPLVTVPELLGEVNSAQFFFLFLIKSGLKRSYYFKHLAVKKLLKHIFKKFFKTLNKCDDFLMLSDVIIKSKNSVWMFYEYKKKKEVIKKKSSI